MLVNRPDSCKTVLNTSGLAKNSNLYFVAIIPPAELSNKITAIKQDFADRFQSTRALRLMPHITLKIPFRLPVDQHDKLREWFQSLPLNQPPFTVHLNGFGAFKNRSAVYVKPVDNPALLTLQERVRSLFEQKFPGTVDNDDREFTPHMTVAFRDLTRENFKEAWKEYELKPFRAEFQVHEIYLLLHNSKWEVISSCDLSVRR